MNPWWQGEVMDREGGTKKAVVRSTPSQAESKTGYQTACGQVLAVTSAYRALGWEFSSSPV